MAVRKSRPSGRLFRCQSRQPDPRVPLRAGGRSRFGRSLLLIGLALCSACGGGPEPASLRFWALGQEGEAVRALLPEFERLHPGVRVELQQIPWSAAHEKLLTAVVGGTLPDVFQLGDTWLAEFVALNALMPLDGAAGALPPRSDFFPGLLAAGEFDGVQVALPWYVDTRVLFYRRDILARAGFADPPATWAEWERALGNIRALADQRQYPLYLPLREWQVPVILAAQLGDTPLRDGDRYGNFRSNGFRRAFGLYLEWFRRGYAPVTATAGGGDFYRDFGRGRFAMVITGPWNIGEFERRLPTAVQPLWDTAPLPAPEPGRCEGASVCRGVSLAGGGSLVMSRSARQPALASALIGFLLEPSQQAEFFRLTGDLPTRRSTWERPPLADAAHVAAFRKQLERIVAMPQIPEWERIADKIGHHAEKAIRGEVTLDQALEAMDRDVDRILEKRRWLLDHGRIRSSSGKVGAP